MQFLRETLIAPSDGQTFGPLPARLSRDVHLTQAEILTQAIQILLQRKRQDRTRKNNLLTLGYGLAHPSSTSNHFIAHSNDIVHYCPNTLVSSLNSKHWVQLHRFIGTTSSSIIHHPSS
jgi:hypothetical protein